MIIYRAGDLAGNRAGDLFRTRKTKGPAIFWKFRTMILHKKFRKCSCTTSFPKSILRLVLGEIKKPKNHSKKKPH